MRIILLLLLCGAGLGATAQNVGIGTASPQSKLHIAPNNAAGVQIDPYGAGAGQSAELRFLEPAGTGTNFVGFKAPDNVAANVIWVLPATDGAGTQVLSTDGAGNMYWQALPGAGSTTIPGHCYTCDGF